MCSAVAADGTGNFVVVWQSGELLRRQPGRLVVGHLRTAGSTPAPLRSGGEFRVNTFTSGQQIGPAVAADPPARSSSLDQRQQLRGTGQDGSAAGVFLQCYDATGTPQVPSASERATTRGPQQAPSVARDASGNFVVVWQSGNYQFTQDGSNSGVFGRRFDPAGTPLGPEFR